MGLFSKKPSFCSVCNKVLTHKHKPKKEWDIKGALCGDCHFDKSKDFYEGTVRQPCVECKKNPKDYRPVGAEMAVGHEGVYYVRNVLIKKKTVIQRKRIFVHCVVERWG